MTLGTRRNLFRWLVGSLLGARRTPHCYPDGFCPALMH